MTEILAIFLQLILFLSIFSYPINSFNLKSLIKINFVNIYLIFSLNIIIHFTLYLFISFISISIKYFFFIEVIFFVLFIFFYKTQIFEKIKNFDFEKNRYFVFFILVNILFFITLAVYPKLQWDGLAHWIYKAKLFFDGGNYFDFKNNIPFSYYPHLGTFVWGYFWKNNILQYEYLGRCIYPFLYILTIFLIASYFFLKKESLNKKILLSLLLIIISLDPFLFGGYQEYLLFFLFTVLGFMKILHFMYPNKTTILYFIILNLNLICWSKQEGFFYVIIIGSILSIYNIKNLKNFFILSSSTILICIISLILKSYVIENDFFNEKIANPELLKYLNLKILVNDLMLIIKHFIISSFKYPIILIILFLLVIFAKRINNKVDKYFYVLFLINLIFVVSIYLQTSMDIEYLLPITIDRILLQTSGMYLIFFIHKLRLLYD